MPEASHKGNATRGKIFLLLPYTSFDLWEALGKYYWHSRMSDKCHPNGKTKKDSFSWRLSYPTEGLPKRISSSLKKPTNVLKWFTECWTVKVSSINTYFILISILPCRCGLEYADCIVRGARGVMVIVVGPVLGHSSSNPERDCLHFTKC